MPSPFQGALGCGAGVLASLLLAAAASPSAADAQGADNREMFVRAAVEAHRAASEAAVMEELRVLLAEPNLASDLPAIRRNAELLVAMLERRGVDARLLELEGKPPAVFGELRALNLGGLAAGGVGVAARNAIPATATAALDVRLVPDQEPTRVRALIERHIREQGYFVVHEEPSTELRRQHPAIVRVQWEDGYGAVRTPLELPASRAVARTAEAVLERPVLRVPMLGGSLPLAFFAQILDAPLVIVPMVNHDNNQHAANENLRIGNFWDGVRTYAGLIALLGSAWAAADAER
jgi:acetylornithine deacetylase/succinyl-diaminopimelate desuccinylase-like protein